MPDLNHQNLATVQSNQQPSPVTVASTTVLAPTTFITYVSGTTDVATVTPPVTGQHMLALIPTDASPFDLLTTGNMTGSTTLAQNVPVLLFYDPAAALYYVK